jgi:hypothetical protein
MAEQGMQERDNRLVLFVAKGTEAIRLADNMRQLGDERKRQVDDEFSHGRAGEQIAVVEI